MCMNDPFKSSDNQQMSASGTSHTDSAGLPTVKVRKRRMGSWLFFALLILLVAALTVRDDLRQKAVERSESVVVTRLKTKPATLSINNYANQIVRFAVAQGLMRH